MPQLPRHFRQIDKQVGKMTSQLVRLYQIILSPDHSPLGKARYPYGYCRFYPSCSEYTRQALENKGIILGIYLGIRRIVKCRPSQTPQVDLLKIN